MSDPQIICPQCSTPIKLTESLAAPLIAETRKQYEQQLASKEADFARRETVLRQTQQDLAKAREAVDEEVAKKLKAERASISEIEARKARVALANELEQRDKQLTDLQLNLSANNAKLAEAQQAQADVLRKQRELDDARRELDLNVEKKVQDSLVAVHAKAKLDAEEGLKAKLSEKEQQVASMKIQIDDLRRKAEQGSQQIQGEALELELEALLRARFPRDLIEPVPKGECGGDVLHRVLGHAGQTCGTIIWESKRTKNWNEAWFAKMRDDQRVAKADIALIVSSVLPETARSSIPSRITTRMTAYRQRICGTGWKACGPPGSTLKLSMTRATRSANDRSNAPSWRHANKHSPQVSALRRTETRVCVNWRRSCCGFISGRKNRDGGRFLSGRPGPKMN
jgi:hypothetical protein